MRFSILFFLIIIVCNRLDAKKIDPSGSYGLNFQSNNYLIENRTSFEITEHKKYVFKENLTITFDLKVRNLKSYGYICRLIDDVEISLQYVPFLSNDTAYFDVVLNRKEKIFHIAVSESDLIKDLWHKVTIMIMPEMDSITFIFDDQIESAPIRIKDRYSPKIVYGLYSSNLDVAAISIRDLVLKSSKNKTLVSLPFNEFQGNTALDEVSGKYITINNPDWLSKKHYFWEEINTLQSNLLADICFDQNQGLLYIAGTDSLIIYDTSTGTFHSLHYGNSFPLNPEKYYAFFNPVANEITIYSFDPSAAKPYEDRIASLDLNSLKWKNEKKVYYYPWYWHHNAFFIKDIIYPVVFGGYGQFKYYNHFISYDTLSLKWKEVFFTGDIIPPRFFSSISQEQNGKYYLFGGFGNIEGKQELGGYNYYDLYEIDAIDRTVSKLWELEPQDSGFVGANTMVSIYNDAVYSLCYAHHEAKTKMWLYRFNIDRPEYSIVSNPIPVTSEKLITKVDLFYSEPSNRFIAAIRENRGEPYSTFRFYSLQYPPLQDQSIYIPVARKNERTSMIQYMLFSLIVLAVIIFLIYIFSTRRRKIHYRSQDVDWTISQLKEHLPVRNALLFLGAFKALSKEGKEVSHLFSPMLQKLLVLIISHQLRTGTGIKSSELSSILWPDKEINESKNIRGVTMNHLRSSLESLEGIKIIHEESCWKIDLSEEIFIDLEYISKFIDSRPKSRVWNYSSEEFKRVFAIVSRGNLMLSHDEDWLDQYKSEIEYKVSELMMDYIDYCNKRGLFNNGISAANIVLLFKPFNEEALQSKIKFMINLGNSDGARNTFNNFVRNYEKIFGQASELSYKNFIRKKS